MAEPKYVAKCPFCKEGHADKRGIVQTQTTYEGHAGFFKYSCGLGIDCAIPQIYQMVHDISMKERKELLARFGPNSH